MIVGDLIDRGFAEIKTGPFGTQLRASDYVERGRPVLNVRNVGFGDVRPKDLEYVGEDTAQRLSSHLLRPKDIVFGRKGAVERHAFINEKYDGAMQGSDCIRLRITDDSPVPPEFVTFALRTKQHQAWMQAFCAHGATMASLNQDIVRQIPLPDLDKAHQDLAVVVLQNIDELLENNRRRVEVLEEMARTIYREWFVNFRYPGHETGASATSALPVGWQQVPISAIAEVRRGISWDRSREAAAGTPVVTIPNIQSRLVLSGCTELSGVTGGERERFGLACGDVLLIGSNGNPDRVGHAVRVSHSEDALFASFLMRVRVTDPNASSRLLFQQLTDVRGVIASIRSTAVGATGLRNLRITAVREAMVALPPRGLLDAFDAAVGDSQDLADKLSQAIDRLGALRDVLLPKLVTGEIDVSTLDLGALDDGRVA